MKPHNTTVLSINSGSSGIKFAMYVEGVSLKLLFSGEIAFRESDTKVSLTDELTQQEIISHIINRGCDDAPKVLIDELEKQECFKTLNLIGHRIVHGMRLTEPQLISSHVLIKLKGISEYDPEHLPAEIELIEAFAKRFPTIPQVACFDTFFHTTMPGVAKLLPVPRWLHDKGIQRYGFHGLSYAYLLEELERIAGKETAHGKIVMAHLGNGASLAAVTNGKGVDTSMGFTPASGILMSTRSGDLDPGVGWYLMQFEKFTPQEFNHLINHESGLLGISETSGDMQELLKIQNTDGRAAEAIELFFYQTKKNIGSFAVVLGGIETLVFSGGIGTHSPKVRSGICSGLQFLGIEIDETKNINNAPIISSDTSKVCVRVIKTNEELMIAKTAIEVLKRNPVFS